MTTNNNNSDLVSSNTTILNSNTFIKTSILALAIGLSSNNLLSNNTNIESATTRIIYNYNGELSYLGAYSNIKKPNYMDRYSNISNSNWFSAAYNDKSLGEILGIE